MKKRIKEMILLCIIAGGMLFPDAVKAQIAPPSAVTPQTFCSDATLADLQAKGANIKWYDAPEKGNELSSATSLEDGTVYYATQSSETEESTTRTGVKVIIVENVTLPAPLITSPQTLAEPATLADILTDGNTNIVWYDASTNGNVVDLSTSLEDGKSYYAAQNSGDCESETRTEVVVNIRDELPDVPNIQSPQQFCDGALIANIAVPNNQILWYALSTGGDPLAPETKLTTGIYYAAQKAGAGESALRTEVEITVSSPLKISSMHIVSQPTCGVDTGRIHISVSGGSGTYEYALNGDNSYQEFSSDGIITGLSAGTHYISVRDKNFPESGVIVSEAVTLKASDNDLEIAVTPAKASACGMIDGSLALTVTGGTDPYQYRLNGSIFANVPANNTLSGLPPGIYIVDVTDANGCLASSGEVLIEAVVGGPDVSVSATTNTTCGNSNGEFTLTVNSGMAPYKCRIEGGAETILMANQATFSGLSAGSHIWKLTDAAGCFAEGRVVIENSDNNDFACTATTSPETIVIQVTGGTAPYAYSLDGGATWTEFANTETEATISNLNIGSYSILVRDAGNCIYKYPGVKVNEKLTRYKVTLPSVGDREGYVLKDENGEPINVKDSMVVDGAAFVFNIELLEDYTQSDTALWAGSNRLVTNAGGFYFIDPVTQDTAITIDGIKLNQYEVTFNSQGGSDVNPIPDAEYGKTITKPTDPTKEGYTFGGWFIEPACTNEWQFGTAKVTQDTTLYARWTLNTYTVTLPGIEGVTYDKQHAWQYQIPHGGDFTFTPTVAEGYSAISGIGASFGHEVVNNGDGSYTIKNVTSDVRVYIYGVTKQQTVTFTLTLKDQSLANCVLFYPGPGTYTVNKGKLFQILAYLADACDESNLVLIANGETITAEEKKNEFRSIAYTFKVPITEDTDIQIVGVERNATGITPQPPEGGAKVWTTPGDLHISMDTPPSGGRGVGVRIYALTGQLVDERPLAEGTTTIPLKKGVYMVVIDDKTVKVIVK